MYEEEVAWKKKYERLASIYRDLCDRLEKSEHNVSTLSSQNKKMQFELEKDQPELSQVQQLLQDRETTLRHIQSIHTKELEAAINSKEYSEEIRRQLEAKCFDLVHRREESKEQLTEATKTLQLARNRHEKMTAVVRGCHTTIKNLNERTPYRPGEVERLLLETVRELEKIQNVKIN